MQASDPAKTTDKSRIALVIGLAVTVVFATIMYLQQAGQISQLASDLTGKEDLIGQQQMEIEEQSSALTLQQEEISEAAQQLQILQGQIDGLSSDIRSIEGLLERRTNEATALRTELLEKEEELEDLESQLGLLQAEIRDKDEDIAELILEKESERFHVVYYGLGVDEDGDGIVFPIEVDILKSGDNRISLDVSNVQYTATFQSTVRTAVDVASDYTGIRVSDKDIIVRLVNKSNSVIRVDGPSAGAAITVMIVAGLQEKELNSDVLVTGTIESDGSIDSVGGLVGKADAANEFGAHTLLVPGGQEFQHEIDIEGVEDINELASRIVLD
ncbi:S16 family serine protease [Candidatus Nitrososphaera sp. FF02]|uniref:S16 family serine protease n=1 Tax=Candidatus Nitrososphaera sp. FF02 TaxID=3398226 RepID=UPI0039EB18FD